MHENVLPHPQLQPLEHAIASDVLAATGSAAFATVCAVEALKDTPNLAAIAAAGVAERVNLNANTKYGTVAQLLEACMGVKNIRNTWAEVQRRATEQRRAALLAEVAPNMPTTAALTGEGLTAADAVVREVVQLILDAELLPVDSVPRVMPGKLVTFFDWTAKLISNAALHYGPAAVADVVDRRSAALDVLENSYLGTCLVGHGGVHGAWRAYLLGHRLDRLEAKGYERAAFEGKSGPAGAMLTAAAATPAGIWGTGKSVLWAAGEALLICADVGAGKTTLAGLLVRALLFGGDVLGQPVRALDPGRRVLYLALDRPEQVKRSLLRQFTPEQLDRLGDRLVIWQGALPADAAVNPDVLADLADFHGAHVVVVDSLKDAALGLAEDRAGAGYNTARQHLLASGRELVELHHLTRGGQDYGSVWLTAGAGSVVRLTGRAGCTSATVKHTKAPAHPVGPLKVTHDRDGGEIELRQPITDAATGRTYDDLVSWVIDHQGSEGVTAADAAQYLRGKTGEADVKYAKRALNAEAELTCRAGGPGRGNVSRWVYVDSDAESEGDSEA